MKYPKKGIGSYLFPFLLIFALLGAGWYIAQNNLNLDDVKRVFQPPEVAKDEKVQIVFQDGNNQLKAWNSQDWEILENDAFLQVGDSLKVGTGSTLVLRFFEGSEIRMNGDTELKLIRMEKDDIVGNNLAMDLVRGRMWARVTDSNTSEGNFIVNTSNQLIQANKAALIDVSLNPEHTRVIAGEVVVNVAEMSNGTRKPVSRLELSTNQEVILDALTIDQLKAGEDDVITALNSEYLSSEWYAWNIDKEERLGLLVDLEDAPEPVEELDELELGLIAVTSHKEGQTVGSQFLLQGTYDQELISSVIVNGDEALLGTEGDWEITVNLSEQNNILRINGVLDGEEQEKKALELTLNVDSTGPAIGDMVQPTVDENNNGTLESDSLEMIGEVGPDAERVCVSHNDSEPAYCLQQFSAGDETYRYLGSVGYGNVVSGQNKYEIYAYDALGNQSKKTIYLFKDQEKPSSAIQNEDTGSSETISSNSNLSTPVITSPDPNTVSEVNESPITIEGTVDAGSQSLLINEKKVSYDSGSTSFSSSVELEEGENLIKVQTVDANGNRSKTAIVRVLYFPPLEDEETGE